MKQQALFTSKSNQLPADFTRTHCESGGKICPYYRPQELPAFMGGVPNRGTCEHPAIRTQTDLGWKADRSGVEYYLMVQVKTGKTRRRKVHQEERPDYIPNLTGCPMRHLKRVNDRTGKQKKDTSLEHTITT